jgi:hypothetical protein
VTGERPDARARLRSSLHRLRHHLDEYDERDEVAGQLFDVVEVDVDRVLRLLDAVHLLATHGRSQWSRVATMNVGLGWPEQYNGVALPRDFADRMNDLLFLVQEWPVGPEEIGLSPSGEVGVRLRLLAGEDVSLYDRWVALPEVCAAESSRHVFPCELLRTRGRVPCTCAGVEVSDDESR